MPRNYGQRLCPRCGQHCPCHYAGRVCPMTDEMRDILSRFKAANGRRWKSLLRELWESGCRSVADEHERQMLVHIRNVIGPTRLDKIRVPEPKAAQ